jgi:hypothetical protein
LLFEGMIAVRERPCSPTPWKDIEQQWGANDAEFRDQAQRASAMLKDVPLALVHWSSFDEPAYIARLRAALPDWRLDDWLQR